MAEKLEGLHKIKANLGKYQEITWNEAKSLMEALMAETEGFAVSHAPWTDRTSAARNGLKAFVEVEKGKILGILATRAPYGIWLEIANGGKYKIIRPSLNVAEQFMLKKFKNIKLPKEL